MERVALRKFDRQGRIVIPKNARKSVLKDAEEVAIISFPDHVRLVPRNADLAKYIDAVTVDVSRFEDYHALRREVAAKRERKP